MRHTIRTVTLLALLSPCADVASGLAGQTASRPIDRWLVTSTGAPMGQAVAPLNATEDRLFPDRDLAVGPGTWRLVREDDAITFRFAADGGVSRATLAHAYVKSGAEGPVELDVAASECADLRVWLNGQALASGPGGRTVRLANGWNTLLVGLPAACPPEVSASLSTARVPLPRDTRPLEPQRLRIRASRPPGVRQNLPAGTLTLDTPRPTHLVWRAEADALSAPVAYRITAWGRTTASAATPEAADDDDAPPDVDLTGEWSITLYLPMGVERLRADLEMDEDGRLEGRLDGERIGGSLRDGWVSADRFGWTTRWSGPGRGVDVRFEGRVENDEMTGTLEFEGARDLEPRPGLESSFGFEGSRGAEDEAVAGAAADTTGEARPAGARPPRSGGRPGFAPPDTETLHAQIRRQLLPPERPGTPAPVAASLELRFDGEKRVESATGLEPGRPLGLSATVPFEKLRRAALDERGLRARIAWDGTTEEREGRIPADAVLEAFHAPIALVDPDGTATGALEGTFRVPEALDGFTLRTLDGVWSVDGEPVPGGALCDPCTRGTRLRIRVTGADDPRVQVADPGYPEAREAGDARAAEEWLRALSEDRRRYRELGRAGGGS